MRSYWLLYDDADFAINRDFAALMREKGTERGLLIEPVLMSELALGMSANGTPTCYRSGKLALLPTAVLSRQREHLVSCHFEKLGVPVYNDSHVCGLCNDKRLTHQFLTGIPMPDTLFLRTDQTDPPEGTRYPVILKPACSHGGDRVALVSNEVEWRLAAARIFPQPALQQRVVSGAGCDLRVYVVFGEIVAGVMRTAKEGVISNFKKGGEVALHQITQGERAIVQRVIRRFEEAGAPLCMAGVDLLYAEGVGNEGQAPVVGEVEDVVGSRMLYQVSDVDLVDVFLDGICERR